MVTLKDLRAIVDCNPNARLIYAIDSSWWTNDPYAVHDCSKAKASPIPLAPNGAVLCETHLRRILEDFDDTLALVGEGGIDLYLFAHHRNCGGRCFKSWDEAREAWIADGRKKFSEAVQA